MINVKSRGYIPKQAQGFAYLWALTTILIIGIYLVAVSKAWQTQEQRAKEEELLRVGTEISQAITRYIADTPPKNWRRYPDTLDDLVKDPRTTQVRRYLRRAYRDPITQDDWGYIMVPGTSHLLIGVHSKSEDLPFKQTDFPKQFSHFEHKQSYTEWRFIGKRFTLPEPKTKPPR